MSCIAVECHHQQTCFSDAVRNLELDAASAAAICSIVLRSGSSSASSAASSLFSSCKQRNSTLATLRSLHTGC